MFHQLIEYFRERSVLILGFGREGRSTYNFIRKHLPEKQIGIADMKQIVPRVIMDCTHSVQRPGAAGGKTGGNREFVPAMALAAKAFGATGYFFEVHPDPDNALSDGPNMLCLDDLNNVIKSLL